MRSGFGRGPFGLGAFGQSDISTAILWDSTPEFNKAAARTGPGGASLESLRRESARAFNERLVRQIRELPLLRDPVQVRDQDTLFVTVVISSSALISAADSDSGIAYNLVEASVPADIGLMEPGWLLRGGTKSYPVRSVQRRNGVFSVFSDTLLTPGSYTVFAPGMMLALAQDFGLDLDGYDYARFQRSVLVAPWRLFGLKGTKKGAQVRASAGGFEADIYHLYRVAAPFVPYIDPDEVYPIDGAYYTTRAPTFPRFDDITIDYLLPSGHSVTDNPCFVELIQWPVTVTGTVDNLDGTWTLTVVEDVGMVATVGRWWMIDAGDTRFFVTATDAGAFEVTVASPSDPGAGAYMLYYSCPITPSCDYCPTHSVLIVLRVVDAVLAADAVALERAYERMIGKIKATLPIHVDVKATIFELSSEATAEAVATDLAEVL